MKKRLILIIAKRMPSNYLRILLYKHLLNYKIGRNVRIGRSWINGNDVTIGDNVVIRDNNVISCDYLFVGANTKINSGNIISGRSSFSIGSDSRIINYHFIDLWNTVTIGNGSWIAGRGCQLWTHGSLHTKSGKKDLGIIIKDNVYVSSSTCIAPGVTIESNNLIGLGSVVSRSILSEENIVVGNPAEVVKRNVNWRENW